MSTNKGGFYPGLILGFLLGVAVSLGVALYVTKAPVPFLDKVPQHSTSGDASEAERNRNWNPNAPLQSGSATRPSAPPPPVSQVPPPPAAAPQVQAPPASVAEMPSVPPGLRQPDPGSTRDPATLLGDKPAAEAGASYFVQTGAFSRLEDAEQQRARLAMMGLTARITEREQTGRTVYRVRLGPFDAREEAESTRERVAGSGLETTLVRVQR